MPASSSWLPVHFASQKSCHHASKTKIVNKFTGLGVDRVWMLLISCAANEQDHQI